jgi:hypothetical protein
MDKINFKMIHHVDQKTIDEMYHAYSPVFVLSTGRSGSKLIVSLLNLSDNVTAHHEPRPTLEYFSDYAFHHQQEEKILSNMIDAARMESILEVFIKNRIYVESNQCLTFFAPVIAGLFKKSKFVHLVRHPGDFVRSAVRKGWHKNDSIWESGRVKMKDKNQWAQMDQIERLSWLWMTTNQFIEDFKTQVHKSRAFTLKFEDLVQKEKTVKKLLKFIGGYYIAPEIIKQTQRTKINELHIHPNEPPTMKKVVDFPLYNHWDVETKNKLAGIIKDTPLRYGYIL